jgi:hypothetical protein
LEPPLARGWQPESECRYVAGKAQNGCGEPLPSQELERKEQAWRAL